VLSPAQRSGLPRDYKIEKAGGVSGAVGCAESTPTRRDDLPTPSDILAEGRGLLIRSPRSTVYGHYQGPRARRRRAWAKDNGERSRLRRGYLAGLRVLYDPANKEEAIAILRKNLTQMSPELAAQSHAALVIQRGLRRRRLDIEGVRKSAELRSQYGEPTKQLNRSLSTRRDLYDAARKSSLDDAAAGSSKGRRA